MKNKKQKLNLQVRGYFAQKQEKEPCDLRAFCSAMPDEDLVKMSRKNKECLGCLIERYDQKIKRYIKRVAGASNESSEEIAQEVFLKVYLNIHKFNPSMKFSSWIYRIAHNEAVNRFLYEKRRRTESLVWEDSGEMKKEVKDNHDIAGEIYKEFVSNEVKQSLNNVSKKYRKVIVLNYFEDKSYKEISEELQKPVNTVGTMLNRGKKMLKRELLRTGIYAEAGL